MIDIYFECIGSAHPGGTSKVKPCTIPHPCLPTRPFARLCPSGEELETRCLGNLWRRHRLWSTRFQKLLGTSMLHGRTCMWVCVCVCVCVAGRARVVHVCRHASFLVLRLSRVALLFFLALADNSICSSTCNLPSWKYKISPSSLVPFFFLSFSPL